MQQTFVDKWKTRLGQKAVIVFCVLIAVVGKSLIAYSYSSLKGDKSLYLLFAKSLLETGVLAEPVQVVENGGSYLLYNPAVHSPLYSLLAALLLWLTKSYFLSQYILSVFSWLIFYTALCQIAKLVFKQDWLVALFLLCSAFFLYPHELASPPKDTFAIGFSLWAILFIHRLLQPNPGLVDAMLLAIAISCLASIKLLYVPVAVVLLAIASFSLLKRKKTHQLLMIGLYATLFIIVALGYFLVLAPAKELTSGAVQLSQNSTNTSGGFHPEYLQYTFPFITSSLFNTHVWAVQLEQFTGLSFTNVMKIFFRIDTVLFFGLLALALYFRKQIIANRILGLLVCASLVMLGVVFALSIMGYATTYKSSGNFWTFVMDARSFLLPMVTLQLALFLFVFQVRKFRLLRLAAFLLFATTCIHGFYFTAKESTRLRKGSDELSTDAQSKIIGLLKENKENKSSALFTSDHFLRRYAQVNNLTAYSFSDQPGNLSWMKKGDRFLIATFPQDSAFRQLFSSNELKLVDTISPFVVHEYTVK